MAPREREHSLDEQPRAKHARVGALPCRQVQVFVSVPVQPPPGSSSPAPSPRLTGRRSARKRASWLPAPCFSACLAAASRHAAAAPHVTASPPHAPRAHGPAAAPLPSPPGSSSGCSSMEGLHFFTGGDTSSGGGTHALVLPRNGAHAHVVDEKLAAAAAAEGAINAVAGCERYVVVRTTPDGNCLSHACSLGVWGVHDHDAELRNAIRCTMCAPGAGAATRRRFSAALQRLGIPEEDWEGEWLRETEAFVGSLRGGRGPSTRSRAFLSDVHCFVLANVLRRPLVIYGDATAMAAGLAGVYLPLLWAEADGGAPCSRVPTSLLFHKSHFSVLATVERAAARGGAHRPGCLPLAVSLGGRATPLPVRFLLPEEEGSQAELLRRWLDVAPAAATQGLPPGIPAFLLPQASCATLRAVAATAQGGK